jgi:ABC-type molybdate transport system substrate-binding protein
MSSMLSLAFILIIALAMSACFGKSGGSGGGGGNSPVSSTITVIASNGQVQATTEVILTIQ